tara:strand:+ start:3899 stop:4819 length:921 start_codon:yes stop_codon:yes gene_type:complete
MKIFLLAPNENWILDRIAKEFKQFRPGILTDSIHECDVVWLLSAWMWKKIPLELLREKKVVATIHHVVPEKFSKEALRDFLMRDNFVNEYHVPCVKTKEFISKITSKPINVIENWYNSDLWYPTEKNSAREALGISKDAYVVGSFQRDTEGSDLKSPKLEKGPDLFVEAVKKIEKENLLVLLGGWRRQYVINRLEKEAIQYKYLELAPIDELRNMYAASDLYIVSSRYEGGPGAILEAAAMKIPIISRDVGMATAILHENCIVDVPNELYFPLKSDVEWCYNNVQQFEIKSLINKYIDVFSNVTRD